MTLDVPRPPPPTSIGARRLVDAWPRAARDHGTFCVSCHTTLPYALAHAALRERLATATASGQRTPDRRRTCRSGCGCGTRSRRITPPATTGESRRIARNRGGAQRVDPRRRRCAERTAQRGHANARFDNMWALQQTGGDRCRRVAVAAVRSGALGRAGLGVLRRRAGRARGRALLRTATRQRRDAGATLEPATATWTANTRRSRSRTASCCCGHRRSCQG